jgi:hypothetical protein
VGCACGSGLPRWMAVNATTGECLLLDEHGACRRFSSAGRARRAAIAAGHVDPGAMKL